jgi:lipopolysaccharide/colanic/teichoic acid biosynthesis glycosyltransferase
LECKKCLLLQYKIINLCIFSELVGHISISWKDHGKMNTLYKESVITWMQSDLYILQLRTASDSEDNFLAKNPGTIEIASIHTSREPTASIFAIYYPEI